MKLQSLHIIPRIWFVQKTLMIILKLFKIVSCQNFFMLKFLSTILLVALHRKNSVAVVEIFIPFGVLD